MKAIRFRKEPDNFYADLRAEIDLYFKINKISTKANAELFSKIILMMSVYILAYTSIYIFGSNLVVLLFLYAFIGGWSVLLGLNIGHDAAHNTIFKKNAHNSLLLYIFELLGTNSYNWKNRHIGAHHTFPNIMNHDSDIQQTNIVKIFPNDEHKFFHGLQHLYMPLLYLLYIFRWVIYRDFKDAYSKNIGAFNNSNYPKKELYKMLASKLIYIAYIVILPYIFLPFGILTFVLGFFVLTVAGSLVITMVLLSTHVGENSNFPEPDENGILPHSWSHHQIMTTSDFGTDNWLINQLFGGFNHHVIHHLFPNICHIHYPKLTRLLVKVAKNHNLPYMHQKYLSLAMLSHFKLLYKNRKNVPHSLQTQH